MLRQVLQALSNVTLAAMVPAVEEHGYTINQLILRWTATSPAQLSANTNNYDPGDANVLRLSASGAINLTGITRGDESRLLTLVNVGTNTITLKNQDANSSAQNRIIGLGAADFALAANVSALLWYDIVTLRWRQVK